MGDVNPINFKKAYDYISKTSSEDIFKRVAIYSAWAGFKYKKNFGHDIIVTLTAAFCGPFDGFNKDPYENIAIKDLLSITNWGWSNIWNTDLSRWIEKYCKTNEDVMYFNNIGTILISGKSDEIYYYLERNSQNPPMIEQYFPELTAFGFLNGNVWPRI